MDNTCKFNAWSSMNLMRTNQRGPEAIGEMMSMTLTDLAKELQEIVEELPEGMTLGEFIDVVMEEEPEETDSETEEPAE